MLSEMFYFIFIIIISGLCVTAVSSLSFKQGADSELLYPKPIQSSDTSSDCG